MAVLLRTGMPQMAHNPVPSPVATLVAAFKTSRTSRLKPRPHTIPQCAYNRCVGDADKPAAIFAHAARPTSFEQHAISFPPRRCPPRPAAHG